MHSSVSWEEYMWKKIKKIAYFLIAGSFTLVISACYGVVAPVANMIGTSKKIKANDINRRPIPGLQVVLYKESDSQNTNFTDTNGIAQVSFDYDHIRYKISDYNIKISDIDGTNNGGNFQPREITLSDNNEYDLTLTNI
jgi:hypothetical protein